MNQLQTSITTDETGKETSHITYEYDAKGNEIHQKDTVTGQEASYTYDVSNQLIYVSGVTEEGRTYTQTNKYNGNGQRIEKSDDGVVTKYYYQDGVVVYTTEEDNTLQSYNYMGMSDTIISTTRYTEDKVSYYVYNKNIQGSTTNVVDQAGNSVLGYTYDDFGNPVEYKLSEVVNEITYTGAIYDHSTGLYYMNARYYDASTGRFISQDSYRGEQLEPGTWHLYTYCANNPINYSDPSGHRVLYKEGKKGVSLGSPPGKCTEYKAPKKGPRKGYKNGKRGWQDTYGNVWVPDNRSGAHGGAHWDVQGDDGSYVNVYPDGKARKGKGNVRYCSPKKYPVRVHNP